MLISILSVIQLPVAKADQQQVHTAPQCYQASDYYWDNSTTRNKVGPQTVSYGSPFCVFLHPGVADGYKTGWSHTLDTLYGTQFALGATTSLPYTDPKPTSTFPGKPLTNAQTRQVFDKYLDYAILASSSDSIGDFQFDIQVLTTIYGIRIYVPGEFQWLAPTKQESIWTDITNDYEYIAVSVRNQYDTYAPGWTRVSIGGDAGIDNNVVIQPGVYHVRFFNLRAPDAAGLYFFKMRFYPVDNSGSTLDIGPGNYPFVIVKSELNPAYVEATVQTSSYPAPPYVSGRIMAEGTTPEGRAVTGVAYWGPINYMGPASGDIAGSAEYMTYLFGLAAGTYTLTAEASGFNPTITDRFTLNAGQSYTKYIVIGNSADVSVVVWSKHGTGAIPWHNLWQLPLGTNNPTATPNDAAGQPRRDILINLYDATGKLIGWWGSDWFANAPWRNKAWGYFGGRGIALSAGSESLAHAFIPGMNQLYGLEGKDEAAPIPSHTSYHAYLKDNFDPTWYFTQLKANERMYPSTQLDGHVPWTYADYVAGMPSGQYSIEAYVTGYIMDEADAYQRTFILGNGHYELQMDLRRSNWIETTLHLDFAALSNPGATFVLTAEDAAGNERAAASFVATMSMLTDDVAGTTHPDPSIDGADVTAAGTQTNTYGAGVYLGGIVIEGWNLLFPYLYSTAPDSQKDYGLNPTASTHTAGTVSLAGNAYTIKVYAADMGTPYAGLPGTGWFQETSTPQASVFLCNTPQTLSFGLVRAKLWISLRSTDFEVPAHSRPWTFPGSDIWVSFMDSSGTVVDTLSPYAYGLIQDAGASNATSKLINGKGFKIPGVNYLDAAATAFYGYGVSPFDVDNVNQVGRHEHVGIYYYGTDPTSTVVDTSYQGPFYALDPGDRPTHLVAGEYTYQAYTHGYIMRRSFPVQVPFAGTADIEADLIQGTQIRVYVKFLHEGVNTPFYGFVRVEVFDSAGNLVGADIYGQAQTNIFDRAGFGGAYLNYNAGNDYQIGSLLELLATGKQQASAAAGFGNITDTITFPSASSPQRAVTSSLWYDIPKNLVSADHTWSSWSHLTPSDANRLILPAGAWQGMDVFGFNWYYGGPTRTWAGGWPTTDGNTHAGDAPRDYGIKGSTDIAGWSGSGGGLYTIKIWAFDPYGPDGKFNNAAPSDDWRMYSMSADLTNINVPWGGAVEYWMTMDDMAKLSGVVRWYDMFGDVRPLPWAQITASDPAQTSPAEGYPAYSTGLGAVAGGSSDSAGAYVMWLPSGSHDVLVSTSEAPGAWSSSAPTLNAQYTVVVAPGWVGGGDSSLGPSGTPVPEVPSSLLAFTMLGALAASVWLLRKKSILHVPVLTK